MIQPMFFYTKLAAIRAAKGLSQYSFSRLLGVRRGAYKEWEMYSCSPREGNRARLEAYLGEDIQTLLTPSSLWPDGSITPAGEVPPHYAGESQDENPEISEGGQAAEGL